MANAALAHILKKSVDMDFHKNKVVFLFLANVAPAYIVKQSVDKVFIYQIC